MYEVDVLENRRDAPDAFTLILQRPKDFDFLAGQFVHLQVLVEERPLRRSYTIASAPHEERIHITIRTQKHGKVSPVLSELTAGDSLKLFGPFGGFTRGEENKSVFVAAGSGITPFISYLRDAQEKQDMRDVSLLYSNKKQADMLYDAELSEIDADWFSYICTLTQESWDKRKGRFNKLDLEEYMDSDTAFYLCGSNLFVRAFTQHLQELGVAFENIRTENYGNIKS